MVPIVIKAIRLLFVEGSVFDAVTIERGSKD